MKMPLAINLSLCIFLLLLKIWCSTLNAFRHLSLPLKTISYTCGYIIYGLIRGQILCLLVSKILIIILLNQLTLVEILSCSPFIANFFNKKIL